MKHQDVQELSSFLLELQRETDRGLPLVGAALIDEKLHDTLESFLCEGKVSHGLLKDPNAPLGSFAARIDMCFSLGLIDAHEYHDISLIRKVRNIFAHHRHGTTFKNEKVQGLCASFKSPTPSDAKHPMDSRYLFTNAVVCIILRLYYRPQWVFREKRSIKAWVKDQDVGWRSFSSDPPPKGVTYVALGKDCAYLVDPKS